MSASLYLIQRTNDYNSSWAHGVDTLKPLNVLWQLRAVPAPSVDIRLDLNKRVCL